jgi:putative membrane protein
MYDSKRLHPAAILLIIGRYLWNLFPLYTVVLFNFSDDLPFTRLINTILLIGMFVTVISFGAFVSWQRFSYTIDETQLLMEHGLFTRKKRSIPKKRIQSMNESEDIIHRLFGLVKLQIDTAGAAGPEVVLRAVAKEEAERIRRELVHSINMADVSEEPIPFPCYTFRLSRKRLLCYAATSGTVGIVLSAVLGLYSEIYDYFPLPIRLSDLSSHSPVFYVTSLFLLACIIWIIGILIVYQKYYNFQAVRQQEDLVITRGLFEKQKLIIPLQRIQAVRVEENWIRQLLQVAAVRLVSASGQGDDHEELKFVCFPLIRKKELSFILRHFLPEFEIRSSIQRLPRRTCKRYIFRSIFPVICLSLAIFYYIPTVRYALPFLLTFTVWIGYKRYKDAGWSIDGQQLTFTTRRFGRSTIFVKRNRIQSLSIHTTIMQEGSALCTIKAYTKSGAGRSVILIKDVDESVGKSVRYWYSYKSNKSLEYMSYYVQEKIKEQNG